MAADKRSYRASAEISAPPARVWGVLVDANAYPSWDSGVVAVDAPEGPVRPGTRLRVTSSVNPGRAFSVRVTVLVPNRKMAWTGGMPLGLFTGERTFVLDEGDDSVTSFTVHEEYTGPLAGMICRAMPDLQPSFDTFAAGLKARCEA